MMLLFYAATGLVLSTATLPTICTTVPYLLYDSSYIKSKVYTCRLDVSEFHCGVNDVAT